MEYLLIVILLLLTGISYICFDKDVMSPCTISCFLFTFLSVIATINVHDWGITIYPFTVMLVTISLLAMIVGGLISKIFIFSVVKKHNYQAECKVFYLPKWLCFIIFIIGIVVVREMYFDVLNKAIAGGYIPGTSLLHYARYSMLNELVPNNKILALFQFLVIGFGFIFIFIAINNYFSVPHTFIIYLKKNWRFMLPIIPLLGVQLLSTGRTGFERVAQCSMFLILIGYQMRNNKKIPLFSMLMIFLTSLLVLFGLFQLLGIFTAKTFVFSPFKMFSIYAGSAMAALNEVVNKEIIVKTNAVGVFTFEGLRALLSRFNIIADIVIEVPMLRFEDGSTTNVFSSLFQYYYDFGLIGCTIIQFLFGFIFCLWYGTVIKQKLFNLNFLLYVYFGYALVRQIMRADFLLAYFSVTHTFVLVFIVIGYYILVYRYNR